MSSMSALKYNMGVAPLAADQSAAANGAVTTVHSGVGAELHPDNPMLWLFGIGAVTLGLIGVSTHVRVANVRAGFDAGKP